MPRERHTENTSRNSDFDAPAFAKAVYRAPEHVDTFDESRTSLRDSSNDRAPELHEVPRWQRRSAAGLPITMQTEQP
jgi:hypothetical protein